MLILIHDVKFKAEAFGAAALRTALSIIVIGSFYNLAFYFLLHSAYRVAYGFPGLQAPAWLVWLSLGRA